MFFCYASPGYDIKTRMSMTDNEKRGLLSSLTRLSESKEIREYEQSLLSRYNGMMKNRLNNLIKKQQGQQFPSFDDLIFPFDDEQSK